MEMTDKDWSAPERAVVAFRLDGDATDATPASGAVHDDSFLVFKNGERSPVTFTAPPKELGDGWRVVVDTREPPRTGDVVRAGASIELAPGSLVLLVEASRESP